MAEFRGISNDYGAMMMADRAYRSGVFDRRESQDDGVDVWAESPYHEDYMRGWRAEHARLSGTESRGGEASLDGKENRRSYDHGKHLLK